MTTVAFTNSADNINPSVPGAKYMGGEGDDVYLISSFIAQPGDPIRIIDTEGNNRLQLVDGLTISSARVMANAMSLILSNNAEIQLIGAASFSFEIGGNSSIGVEGKIKGYADFVSENLGTSVPQGSGSSQVNTPVVIHREPPGPDPDPQGTEKSVDVGTLANPQQIDASGGNYVLTDNAQVATCVVVNGFSNGDRIEVSNASQGDYQFSNDGSDVIITSNMAGGTINQITLVGVTDPNSVISGTDPNQLNTSLGINNAFTFV